jgi:hypothetical protein
MPLHAGGHCIKKSEPTSSKTPNFARAERVVALTRQVRSDYAGSASAALDDSRGQTQKFPCIFFAPPPPTPPPRSGKRNGKEIFGLRRHTIFSPRTPPQIAQERQ